MAASLLAVLPAAADAQISVPVASSPNVRLIPQMGTAETTAISGVHATTGKFFYTSSLDSISVFDTTDPKQPRLRGTIPNLVFENEAMSYGERVIDGKLVRFLLVGNDLYNVSADPVSGPKRGRIGGGEVIVVDVTNPDAPFVRSRTPMSGEGSVTTSTHTVKCLRTACGTAYSAGDGGEFSVIDLHNLDAPKQIAVRPSPAAGPNPVFTGGSGHYWDVDDAGIAWHTGSGGAAAFDVTDPVNPKPLATTNAQGTQSPYNDFILHNSKRPNARSYRTTSTPSLKNGNVLLVTEEDYFNDGEEVQCSEAGTFQTWQIGNIKTPGSIRPLDITNPVAEFGGGLSTPAGAFCSAHWFDFNQTGIVAQGYYQQGLRLLDVRDPKNIKQFGYFTGVASEVWDAYWVPERDASGRQTGRKTNIVYTADLVRGVDVFEVDLP